MASFEKRSIEENTFYPEICGVSFSSRVAEYIGQLVLEEEPYTVWIDVEDDDTGEGYEEQITPLNSRVYISVLDDDSDTITVLDRRDGLWFNFMRITHPDIFDSIAQMISPWSTVTASLVPLEEPYKRMLAVLSKDTDTDDLFIPDNWV